MRTISVGLLALVALPLLAAKHPPRDVFPALKHERVDYWVSKGAQLSPTVKSLLKKNKVA